MLFCCALDAFGAHCIGPFSSRYRYPVSSDHSQHFVCADRGPRGFRFYEEITSHLDLKRNLGVHSRCHQQSPRDIAALIFWIHFVCGWILEYFYSLSDLATICTNTVLLSLSLSFIISVLSAAKAIEIESKRQDQSFHPHNKNQTNKSNQMSSPNNNSSLRPGWFKGSGSGKGFQPPPTAADRGEKGRSGSIGSSGEGRRDSNKFAALLDDDDVVVGNGGDASPTSSAKPSTNSRSEAFRSGFNRSSSTGTGTKSSGRSLADLAAKVPEPASAGRRHSSFGEGVRPATGRFSALRASDGGVAGGSIDAYKPDPKVTRYTREKLLSLRPAPKNPDPGPPDVLKPLEGSVIYSATAQDPVCWDTFDAETIWETVRERRASVLAKVGVEGDPRRRNAPNTGRWTRGLALPPQEEAARRREREADNPNELWDDPMGGTVGAASDFSAFGAMPADDDDGAFDFDKMAEASKKLEEELHGKSRNDDDDDDELEKQTSKKVDVSRPLASAGTTLVSGSGDDVNVFEDFDAPSEPGSVAEETEGKPLGAETPAVRGGDEDPSASSRLMKMIGVTKGTDDSLKDLGNNPWGVDPINSATGTTVDPIIGAIGGGSLSLNPWGDTVAGATGAQPGALGLGLSAFGANTNSREAQLAAERQKAAQHEAEMLRRRQQEEEAQRRAMAEQKARQQQASIQQQQQQPTQQSQIELVLMERICLILENSWGRSDLASILSTLHAEDSRVIPLLQNTDSLRALIARSPQRVAIRRDPGYGAEMAVLLLTNAQWQQQQQQQQQQLQQEEIRRRRQMEEEANRAKTQSRLIASINHDAPWFYSDPQNNIQVRLLLRRCVCLRTFPTLSHFVYLSRHRVHSVVKK
jgi:hypothetical protein